MTEGPFEGERIRALREVLTATGAGIYLSTHLAGPLPSETLAAVRELDDLELRLGRTGPDPPRTSPSAKRRRARSWRRSSGRRPSGSC